MAGHRAGDLGARLVRGVEHLLAEREKRLERFHRLIHIGILPRRSRGARAEARMEAQRRTSPKREEKAALDPLVTFRPSKVWMLGRLTDAVVLEPLSHIKWNRA